MTPYEWRVRSKKLLDAAVAMLPEERTWTEDGLRTWLEMVEGIVRWSYGLPKPSPPLPEVTEHRLLSEVCLRSLQESPGVAIHTASLYQRALEAGCRSRSSDPKSVVDATLRNLQKQGEPLERTGTYTWRWTGS